MFDNLVRGIKVALLRDGEGYVRDCGDYTYTTTKRQVSIDEIPPRIRKEDEINFCPHCGAKVQTAGAKFCVSCGKSLVDE